MTLAQIASLFNVSAVLVVLVLSAWVARRYPLPFFLQWLSASVAGALLMGVEWAAQALGRPWPLSLLEVALMASAAWGYFQAGRLLDGRASGWWPFMLGLPALLLVAGGVLAANGPFPLALTPTLLVFSASLLSVAWVLVRQGATVRGLRPLGAGVALLGVWPLTYPLFEHLKVDWLGFWISGVLHMIVGGGMIVYVIEEVTVRLREQNERLRELDQLKSHFVSTVSHELRTPLTAIVGYLELLEDGIGGGLAPVQQEYVENMRQSASHLAGLVDTILDSMRLQHGSLAMRREPVDMGERVFGAIETMRAVAERKGVRLEVAPFDPPPLAEGDAVRVTQVLHNLVGNAIKFTGAGGTVRLAIDAPEAPVASVRVRVIDTGIGIPADQLGRVFEPFFQVDAGLTRAHGGTGLGLSIVGEMIGAMDGQVGVESVEGEGSIFWFTLPQLNEPPVLLPPAPTRVGEPRPI